MQPPIKHHETKEAHGERKSAVWVIEDNADTRRVLNRVLNRSSRLSCPAAFSSCEDALEALRKQPAPEAILMDVGLPGMNGIDGIKRLKAVAPEIHLIVLTVFDDEEKVFKAICAGASGYLLKNADEDAIADAVQEALNGGAPINPRIARLVLKMIPGRAKAPSQSYGLTDREREVLELMVHGLVKKEIAQRLNLSYHTVDNHLRGIYEKLQVHTRGSAVAKALSEQLVK